MWLISMNDAGNTNSLYRVLGTVEVSGERSMLIPPIGRRLQ